jgi:very-short-patch-repair endonuclease
VKQGTREARDAVVKAVRRSGGVVRSRSLIRAGHPERAIAAAVVEGELHRTRRVWIALPDADPAVVRAASAGVVLSCITAAVRQGLWVLAADGEHVAAPPHAGRISLPGAHIHRAAPLIPRHPDALVDPIENVLALVADCQPFEAALAVWESALRKGLVEAPALARLPLRARAREILDAAAPYSDSGLETFVVPRLRWLRVRIVPQAWIRGHRVDFLLGDRLILQIDGGTHVGAQREQDVRQDAELMLLGYHVIRVGYAQVVNDWPAVQALVMRAIAQGLHLAR